MACLAGGVLTRQMEGSLLQGLQSLLEHIPPGHASGAQVVLEETEREPLDKTKGEQGPRVDGQNCLGGKKTKE